MAINHNLHGRDGTRDDLCDVCFWREVVKELEAQIAGRKSENDILRDRIKSLINKGAE